jgi:hypothetical protein
VYLRAEVVGFLWCCESRLAAARSRSRRARMEKLSTLLRPGVVELAPRAALRKQPTHLLLPCHHPRARAASNIKLSDSANHFLVFCSTCATKRRPVLVAKMSFAHKSLKQNKKHGTG